MGKHSGFQGNVCAGRGCEACLGTGVVGGTTLQRKPLHPIKGFVEFLLML